jgi:hypothetical protein
VKKASGDRLAVPWPVADKVSYLVACAGRVRDLVDGAPVEHVDVAALTAIQETVSVARVKEHARNPGLAGGRINPKTGNPKDLPIVVRLGAREFIHDGHHRLAAAWAKAPTPFPDRPLMVPARVVDLDAEARARAAAQAEKSSGTKVQTLIFSKKRFSRKQAVAWARTHDFRSNDVDETDETFRLRQRDPKRFKPGSFRTIQLTKGVHAVIGRLR